MKKHLIFLIFLLLGGCKATEKFEIINDSGFEDVKRTVVYICGEVQLPGVYEIDGETLLIDLVKKAGGFTEYAEISQINLAKVLSENEKVIIPSIKDLSENKENLILININTANLQELMMLPKIGKAKAESIINYRIKNGNFLQIEDLLNVTGIGEGIFDEIKTSITV